jgi:hypothetical protein
MRLPNMTTRRLLITIAGLGLFLGSLIEEGRRRAAYSERFNYHLQQMEGAGGPYTMFHETPRESQEHLIRSWIYHAMMWQKYRDALSFPFRYVEPDPPEPN